MKKLIQLRWARLEYLFVTNGNTFRYAPKEVPWGVVVNTFWIAGLAPALGGIFKRLTFFAFQLNLNPVS